jgi:hypothetical protein
MLSKHLRNFRDKRQRKNTIALARDFFMIVVGIVFAFILSKLGIIDAVVSIFRDYYIVACFVSGIFFTSIFTIAPSSVTLVHLSKTAPIPSVIFWGALGAMFGDLILFLFIKDRFADDLKKVFKPTSVRYLLKSFHLGFMRWLSPVIGALIIASPLPDEFGITLLGMSKMKISILLPIAFVMNMLGIYLLIEFSHYL